jgi:hypothetical protein
MVTRVAFGLVVLASMLGVACLRAASAVASLPSQTDGVIAFQRNDDADGEVWLIDPSQASPESTAVKVTSDPAPEARPAWGPTFHRNQPADPPPTWDLAFQRYENGTWDIWKRTTPTTTFPPTFGPAAPLVAGPGNQEQPAFSDVLSSSSSVTLLAYVSDETGSREVWLRDGTGALHQLTSDGAGYANPDFAARFHGGTPGSGLLGLTFESTRGGQRGIWAVDLDIEAGGRFLGAHDLRPVALGPEETSEPSWQVTNPPVAPFGRFNDVLFTTRAAGATYLDYVEEPVAGHIPFADPTQSVRYQLTGDPGGDSSAVWAPFGDRIAFTRTLAGSSDLWVMSPDGTGPRRLTTYPGPDLYPSWQPAQESSADRVGGHTYPAPVSRTAKGGKGGTPTGTPPRGTTPVSATPVSDRPRRWAPGLALRGVRWHAGRVTLAGGAARGLGGRVRVAFACGHRRSQHTQRRVRARSGRFAARLRVPRACRRARRGVVAVAYGGDRRYRAQKISRRVRRR